MTPTDPKDARPPYIMPSVIIDIHWFRIETLHAENHPPPAYEHTDPDTGEAACFLCFMRWHNFRTVEAEYVAYGIKRSFLTHPPPNSPYGVLVCRDCAHHIRQRLDRQPSAR